MFPTQPLSQTGATAVTQRTDTGVKEDKRAMAVLPDLPSVERWRRPLNALACRPVT